MTAFLPPCVATIGKSVTAVRPSFSRAHPHCIDCRQREELACQSHSVAARSNIFTDSDPQTHVYLIVSGVVRLCKALQNGKRQILSFKFAGDFIELEPKERHHYTAQAINNVSLRSFPIAAFYTAAASDSQFMMKLYNSVSADVVRTRELALTIGQRDADGAMAAFLLEVSLKAPQCLTADGFISLPMPRTDIADYVGLTHETVSRILTHFRKHKVISLRGRRDVRINKAATLLALAEGENRGPRRTRHH